MYIAFLVLCFVNFSYAHREHKVHNIVLYPEKHSWCKTTPIKQVVGHPGCEQLEVDNNVCVGACFSYSIPRTEPTAPGEVAPYCDSCQPSRVTWKHVTLKCTEATEGETLTKKVEIIENCSCLTCRPHESSHHGPLSPSNLSPSSSSSSSYTFPYNVQQSEAQTSGDGPTGDDSGEDLQEPPQLLNVMEGPPKINSSHIQQSSKLNLLLKMLAGAEEEDAETTGQRLSSLIEIIKEKGVKDDELEGLAKKSEGTGQLKVDLEKLKEILQKIEGRNEIEAENDEGDRKIIEEAEVKTEAPTRHHQSSHELHLTPIVHHAKIKDEDETHSPTLDVPHHHLRPAIEGDEISYLPHHRTHHHTQTPEA